MPRSRTATSKASSRARLTSVDTYAFQPLLPGIGNSTQPIVLPVINQNWQSEPDALGGRWNLNANLLDIIREVGTQTRRLSLGSQWERDFEDGIGGQYKFTASLRGDGYWVNNLSASSNPDLPSAFFSQNGMPPLAPTATNFVTGRAFPQVGLQWSYPLVHPGSSLTPLIEPIAAVYAAPNGGNQRQIPNEDSLSFEYDDTDLFRPDRLAGYDILDTGQRVDYGLKLGLYDNSGGSWRALVGQSYRAETNPFLPPGSGAEQRLSDIVGRVVLSPNSYLDLIYRFRLDGNTFANRGQQVSISAGPANLRLSANFLEVPPELPSEVAFNPATGTTVLYGKQEQLSLHGHRQAHPLLVVARQRDAQPDQQHQSDQRRADGGIEKRQPLRHPGGGLSGRMHGLCRPADAIGHHQRRGDARHLGAVQRRVQESRRGRRHRRVDFRRCPSLAARGRHGRGDSTPRNDVESSHG